MAKIPAGTRVRVSNIYGDTIGTLRKDTYSGYGLVELVVDGNPFRTEGRVERAPENPEEQK